MANTQKVRNPVVTSIRIDAIDQLIIQRIQAEYACSQNDMVRAAIAVFSSLKRDEIIAALKEVK